MVEAKVKETRNKIILLSFLFGILSVFLVVFFVYPLFKDINDNLENIKREKKEVIFSKKEASDFHKLREAYKKTKESLDKINKLFVNYDVPVNLIQFLEKTADKNQLSINISPSIERGRQAQKKGKDKFWRSVNFRLTLTGQFPLFLNFLEEIELGPYLLTVDNLTISRLIKKGNIETNNVKVNLLLSAFAK